MQMASLPLALALALITPAAFAAGNVNVTGTVTSSSVSLPTGRVTAEEHRNLIRILSQHNATTTGIVPRRMYSASCVTSGGVRKFFASLTTRSSSGGSYQGTVISGDVSSTGSVSNFSSQTFSACKEMNGIVADASCSTVAALCRRSSGATGATKDLVASLPNDGGGNWWRDWLTAEWYDDQMWLYEWKGNPATPTSTTSAYNQFVVSKAIPSGLDGQHGHHNLAMTSGQYGISLRSESGKDANGFQHGADAMIVVNRSTTAANTSIDTTRGWPWACAPGHTLAHRIAVNNGGKFAALCTTDQDGQFGIAHKSSAVSMRVEAPGKFQPTDAKRAHGVYVQLDQNGNPVNIYNGGGTSLLPSPDGGFTGVSVATPSTTTAQRSQIKLMRFTADGTLNFESWFRTDQTYFLSYPQLVFLGNDTAGFPRYLIGWAQMMASGTSPSAALLTPSPANSQRLATKYFVQEIDASGNWKSAVLEVTNGWGEQDQMVSLGNGRAGWVQRPDPRWKTTLPSPNSTSVTFTTYKSNTM
jgi:hypothetical protein